MPTFYEFKKSIEDVVEDFTLKQEGSVLSASRPRLEYNKGKTEGSFIIRPIGKEVAIDLIDAICDNYLGFVEIKKGDFTYYIEAGKENRRWIKEKDKTDNEIRIELRIDAYDREHRDCTSIGFIKDTDWNQTDLVCFLELWKKYAKPKKADENCMIDKSECLRKQGAILYESESFTWDMIAGYDSVKREVIDTVIIPFQNPEVLAQLSALTRKFPGNNRPRGVLFEGPPGTGKTTMAKVIASESEMPLVYVPVEGIMSKWYGEAEGRLSNIFDLCKDSILFLDEIDSLAGSRDSYMHEATRRVLSVLLRKMQGLQKNNVLTIGATNRKEDLDRALMNRFDRVINFPLPNKNERKAIFSLYAQQLPDEQIDLLAQKSDGFSGREIENICNDSERIWARMMIKNGREVTTPPLMQYLEALKNRK